VDRPLPQLSHDIGWRAAEAVLVARSGDSFARALEPRRPLAVRLAASAVLPLCFALLLITLLTLANAAHDDGRVSSITRHVDTSSN
jgi:hypothetical protein